MNGAVAADSQSRSKKVMAQEAVWRGVPQRRVSFSLGGACSAFEVQV